MSSEKRARLCELTSPAMGVESLLTLLIIPGLSLLSRLWKKEQRGNQGDGDGKVRAAGHWPRWSD